MAAKKPKVNNALQVGAEITVALRDLKADPENARTHGPKNIDAIMASLRQFGQVEPLVVQAATNQVIGGHGRV